MKHKKRLFKLLSVVLILITAVYAGSLVFRGAEISMPTLFQPARGSRLFMSMEGFRFAQSENGRIAWRMTAGRADLYENKEAQLKDLEIAFIAADGKQAALRGESGTMNTETGNASIRSINHDVRILTSEGYLLTTNSLFWKAGERSVSTPDQFKLLGRELYLEGKGLSANVDMRTIVVNSHVKAVLQE